MDWMGDCGGGELDDRDRQMVDGCVAECHPNPKL